jgi:hypothetical protein
MPPGGDLKPTESVDGHGIRLEAPHVAKHGARIALA